MPTQNVLLIYTLSKAIAAAKVDYDRLRYLNADFALIRDSGHQELNEWENHNLQELYDLMYSANSHTTISEAKEDLHYLCTSIKYLTSQDPDVQRLLEDANKILNEEGQLIMIDEIEVGKKYRLIDVEGFVTFKGHAEYNRRLLSNKDVFDENLCVVITTEGEGYGGNDEKTHIISPNEYHLFELVGEDMKRSIQEIFNSVIANRLRSLISWF